MRILVTVPWSERLGGAEAMLQSVLDGAREEGHELELVFFEPGSWPAELTDAGFRVLVIPARRLREVHRWALTVVRLTRIMRSRRPDLILNWAAKSHFYGAPAAVLAGMADRVVLWQHAIPTHARIDKLATLFPAAAIGCYCTEAAEAQARLLPRRPVFVVAPGTAVPDARPRENGAQREDVARRGYARPRKDAAQRNDIPVVGLVGRLQPWKGQDRLLRAQALLRDRGRPIHTLIVGGDAYGLSPDYAESLPSLIDGLGLDGAVTMTGQVPDAGPYIERMDILVNASDPEPFGIVLLEGMARGVPVVAVDSGGPAELIQHGRTGLLARSGEPDALADALEPLVASPQLRRDLGHAGHETFQREFTDAAMRKRFFANLERVRRQAAGAAAACEVTIVAHDVGSIGGMERVLAELALGLRGLGHEVTVIARTCDLPAGAGVRFHRVRGPRRPVLIAHPWFMLAGSLTLARWRRGTSGRRRGMSGRRGGASSRRRAVVHTTGPIVLGRVDVVAVHYCHQVGPANPSRRTLPYRLHAQLVRRLFRAAERLCYRTSGAATFVCVSEGVAEELREHFRYLDRDGRVIAIQNGVDTDAFAPGLRASEARALRDRLQIAPDRPVALFVGGEWSRKGLEPAIRALACAPEWDLVVAGSGDSERYRELADSIGVGRAVRWLGVFADVALLYELADALVFPSSYEAFPLVALEAAASGLPILATPINGIRELVHDGIEGFLIDRDPDTIAERFRLLAADPELRERMGRAARQAGLRFSWARTVARHHELYERLAAARG